MRDDHNAIAFNLFLSIHPRQVRLYAVSGTCYNTYVAAEATRSVRFVAVRWKKFILDRQILVGTSNLTLGPEGCRLASGAWG